MSSVPHRGNYRGYIGLYPQVIAIGTVVGVASDLGRHPVAALIDEALQRLGKNQAWLGAQVAALEERGNPYSQPAVSDWLARIDEQLPGRVFDIEQALGVKPGVLSRLLGFVPADSRPAKTVEAAIDADPLLDDRGRRLLKAMLAELRR